jgi:hypothetical protein
MENNMAASKLKNGSSNSTSGYTSQRLESKVGLPEKSDMFGAALSSTDDRGSSPSVYGK